MSKAVEVMQSAFEADPNAIHALTCMRVPCGKALVDHPTVLVDRSPVLGRDLAQVGVMGLINGILSAMGQPLVALKFDDEQDEFGRHKLLGFCEYQQVKLSEP